MNCSVQNEAPPCCKILILRAINNSFIFAGEVLQNLDFAALLRVTVLGPGSSFLPIYRLVYGFRDFLCMTIL